MQQRLEGAQTALASRDWKERVEGLEALLAASTAAGRLPAEARLWVVVQLVAPVADANLRVQQQVRGMGVWVGIGGSCRRYTALLVVR